MAMLSKHERFESHVERVTETGCWIWMAAIDKSSSTVSRLEYGKFWDNDFKKSIVAHRAAWMLYRGEITEGMIVTHSCDTPQCVNPNHLKLGTFKDNTHDMIRKCRHLPMVKTRQGVNSNFNKLSESDVLRILQDNRVQRIVALDYGVTQTCISLIKRRANWKHLQTNLDTGTTKTEPHAIP